MSAIASEREQPLFDSKDRKRPVFLLYPIMGTTSTDAARHLAQHGDEGEEIDLEGWEEWNGQGSFLHHCIAGSMAGVSEHVLMFPVDTYKVSHNSLDEEHDSVTPVLN